MPELADWRTAVTVATSPLHSLTCSRNSQNV